MSFLKRKAKETPPAKEVDNQLFEAVYRWLNSGTTLRRDNLKTYVTLGFEGNPDVYSIINNIAAKFAQVPFKLISIDAKGEETELKSHELIDILKKPNSYQKWYEFAYLWEAFRCTTGNSIVYAPKLEFGNNQGKLAGNGLMITPSQNVEIVSNGMFNPIGYYKLDIDSQQTKIMPEDVIHTRLPGMTYNDGRNFMGQSPLKSALYLIFTQNKGYELLGKMYENPLPPGMLVDEGQTSQPSVEAQSAFEKLWKKKFGKGNSTGMPILTGGKKQWINLMTSTINDLMVGDTLKNGARVLANVLNWPSALMNDAAAMTLDNLKVFVKLAYTDRIKPDITAMLNGFNDSFVQAYAKINERLELRPDFSKVEELQADKKLTAEWLGILVDKGVITRDEARKVLEFDATELEGMQKHTMAFNLVDVDGEVEPTDTDTQKNLKGNEIYK